MTLPQEIALLQTYECHPNGEKFPSGLCKPSPGSTNIPDAVRIALYEECLRNNGDSYTSIPCEHLTDELAKRLGVCAYGKSPTVFGDLVKFLEENGDLVAVLVRAILASSDRSDP